MNFRGKRNAQTNILSFCCLRSFSRAIKSLFGFHFLLTRTSMSKPLITSELLRCALVLGLGLVRQNYYKMMKTCLDNGFYPIYFHNVEQPINNDKYFEKPYNKKVKYHKTTTNIHDPGCCVSYGLLTDYISLSNHLRSENKSD